MYAVIESGGKQHRVAEGEILKLEKLEVATGESIQFDKVLMVTEGDDIRLGAPYIDGTAVTAEVLSQGRHKKIKIVKFNRRKHFRKETGHRQWYTEVKITAIGAAGAKPKAAAKKKPEASTKKAATPKAAGVDDLTRISGVGPVLVGKLKDSGITTFAQIAAFTADDILALDEKLNFKGRIDRDDWVGQAKAFLEE